MPNTTNFNFPTPADTDLVKDGASAIRSLGNSIDTAFVDLKGGTTGQVLSKASNTDLDFTWSSVDPLTILDAKGDLISATAADTPARLASSGVNGDILTVDTSTATGLKWAAPAASGGMTLIQETVASANSSLSFTSIPGTYKNLILAWSGIFHSTTGSTFNLRLNNDSSTIYRYRAIADDNATYTPYNSNSADRLTAQNRYGIFGVDVTQTEFYNRGMGFVQIENYASTTRVKNITGMWSTVYTGQGVQHTFNYIGAFDTTTAVTSLDIVRISGSATFSNMSNTSIRLYGVS